MKNLHSITLGIAFTILSVSAKGQLALDNQNIAQANNALGANHNCDNALMYLRMVSDSGKLKADYLLAIGKANDCKENGPQAIYYFTKYLELNPGDDTIKKRVAELKDQNNQKKEVTTEEKQANAIYKNAQKGKNSHGRGGIYEKDFVWGFSGDQFTGGTNSPYKEEISLYNNYMFPMAKNRMLFECSVHIGVMAGGQKEWFARVFDCPIGNVKKVPGAMEGGFEISFSGVIINKHDFAWTAGPITGISLYTMPSIDVDSISNTYSSPVMISPIIGLSSEILLGKHVFMSLQYNYFLKSSFSNELNHETTVTPVNGNSLRFSIGLRGFGFPYDSWR